MIIYFKVELINKTKIKRGFNEVFEKLSKLLKNDNQKIGIDMIAVIIIFIVVIIFGVYEGANFIINKSSQNSGQEVSNNSISNGLNKNGTKINNGQTNTNQTGSTGTNTNTTTGTSTTNPKVKRTPEFIELYAGPSAQTNTSQAILKEIQKEYNGKIIVKFLDVTKDRSLSTKYKLKGFPTQILIDEDGDEIFRHIGGFVDITNVRELLNELGIK